MSRIDEWIPIDFSHCGYRGGGIPLPYVPAVYQLKPVEGDATDYIQSAIDEVAKRPLNEHGFRGAVILAKGTYELEGRLRIVDSGIIVRGHGADEHGTVLVAKGTSRQPLLSVGTHVNYPKRVPFKIIDKYISVGGTEFTLKDVRSFKIGDRIWIERPTTLAWVEAIGMTPDGFDRIAHRFWANPSIDAGSMWWDREITNITGKTITIDVPITTAIDGSYGGGRIYHHEAPQRIRQVGIEHLCLRSAYDSANPKDENHAWDAVQMRNVEDAWVNEVSATHFAGSAVALLHGTKRITVSNCGAYAPVCEDATGRGRAFYTLGQQTLFLRCYAEQARHDFTAGRSLIASEFPTNAVKSGQITIPIDPAATGPNAFVQCRSVGTTQYCGPLQYWSSGVLYDQMDISGAAIRLQNVGAMARASGWNGANSVIWNSQAERIECDAPPTAQNWAIGHADKAKGSGVIVEELGELPPGLYAAQLKNRMGDAAWQALQEQRKESLALSAQEATDWNEIPNRATQTAIEITSSAPKSKYAVHNGWFAYDGQPIWGFGKFSGYWQMIIQRASITRNSLEELGQGKTEMMSDRVKAMTRYAYPFWYHSFGLWYDRRRDLHLTDPQPDGDVFPPFYELPWARSGQGQAWDGLSKYDLTKFNSFYFAQLEQFVKEAHRHGVVLIHNYYLQHCITGGSKSHYVDFPWRPVNCIQPVEMPDEIQAANAFYDVSIPLHRELHRKYIFKCLDVIGSYDNVIHLTSAEYTGPKEFVQFWTDTINEWEQATGHKVTIGLGATKDVSEELLADPVYEHKYDVLEMTYWNYNTDGTIEACEGGKEVHFGWPSRGTSPQKVYEQMKEARLNYPQKGLIKMLTLDQEHGGTYCDDPEVWREYALACLMGGGAVPAVHSHVVVNLDRNYGPPMQTNGIQALYHWLRTELGDQLLQMKPIELAESSSSSSDSANIWALENSDASSYLVCYVHGGTASLGAQNREFRAKWFHIPSGFTDEAVGIQQHDGRIIFEAPDQDPWMLYVAALSGDTRNESV